MKIHTFFEVTQNGVVLEVSTHCILFAYHPLRPCSIVGDARFEYAAPSRHVPWQPIRKSSISEHRGDKENSSGVASSSAQHNRVVFITEINCGDS
jgi:hypothetical protein